MRGGLVLLLFSFLSSPLFAEGGSCSFHRSIENPMQFRNIELINRNPKVGLHREESLSLRTWVALSDRSFVGLDGRGRLLWVANLAERPMAFLLSGTLNLRAFFLSEEGHLLAVDSAGEVYQYGPAKWSKSRIQYVVRRYLASTGLSLCSLGLTVSLIEFLGWDAARGVSLGEITAVAGLGGAATTLVNVLAGLIYYGNDNEVPNGLVKIGLQVHDMVNVESTELTALVADYNLRSNQGAISLNALIRDERSKFNSEWKTEFLESCEMLLLPRGIPTREYENPFAPRARP